MFDPCLLFENKTIKAVIDLNMKKEIQSALVLLKENGMKKKQIARKFGFTYQQFWKTVNKKAIPLEFLAELQSLSTTQVLNKIKYIEAGPRRKKIKFPYRISIPLAKIIGAILADGHLKRRSTTWGENKKAEHFELVLREEYESNMKSFSNWMNDVFEVDQKPKKKDKHFEYYISNKPLFLFLTKILQIPQGEKHSIIRVPKYILTNTNNIKIGFLQGIFMFDGGVDFRNGNISLMLKNKKIIKEIAQLLKSLQISPDYVSKKGDKYGRWRIEIRQIKKIKKGLKLFAIKTQKWFLLKEHLEGFKGPKIKLTKDSFKDLINKMDKFYPKKRYNSVSFSEVLKIFYSNCQLEFKTLKEKITRQKTVTYEILSKLEKLSLLASKRKDLNKVWFLPKLIPNIRRNNNG